MSKGGVGHRVVEMPPGPASDSPVLGCSKAAYASEREAATSEAARRHPDQRPYRCAGCGRWHLTSSTGRTRNRDRGRRW